MMEKSSLKSLADNANSLIGTVERLETAMWKAAEVGLYFCEFSVPEAVRKEILDLLGKAGFGIAWSDNKLKIWWNHVD